MSTIKPFRAVRPTQDRVSEVAALPYDVYSSDEAREVVADKPYSFLKIDRAETFFEKGIDIYSQQVYEKARDTLYGWLEEGILIQEEQEALYLYELVMDGRSQTGIVACTSIDEYLNNTIKKHEKTRADKEQDRINHVDFCDANTGPIFLTYRHQAAIDSKVKEVMSQNSPIYDMVADDGIVHRCWKIDSSEDVALLVESFKGIDSLYIADGHHRAASACKVGLKRREENPGYDGSEEFNYFLSVIFPDNQLKIMDYNRVVKDLNGMSHHEFLDDMLHQFELLESSENQIRPVKKGTFSMFMDGRWYLYEAKTGTFDSSDPVLSLDVSILQLNVLSPLLGIGDPRTDKRIDFVGGIRGLKELERRCSVDMELAFAMVPTSVDELMAIADADELMPPKSTWFEPKLRSGIFIHLLK